MRHFQDIKRTAIYRYQQKRNRGRMLNGRQREKADSITRVAAEEIYLLSKTHDVRSPDFPERVRRNVAVRVSVISAILPFLTPLLNWLVKLLIEELIKDLNKFSGDNESDVLREFSLQAQG